MKNELADTSSGQETLSSLSDDDEDLNRKSSKPMQTIQTEQDA